MTPLSVLTIFFVALLISRTAAQALRRVGSPATVLEIGLGFIIGNFLLSQGEIAFIRGFAEMGTVILFFFVGLSMHTASFKGAGRHFLRIAGLGSLVPMATMFALSPLLELPRSQLLLATAVVMTSGAGVAARVLREGGFLNSRSGRVLVAASIIDDIPSILFLAGATTFAAASGNLLTALLTPFLTLALLAVTLRVVARLPWLKDVSALYPLGIAMIAAWITAQAGVTALAGAFLAGLFLAPIIKEREAAYIESLLDLCVPIFFLFVGTLISAAALFEASNWLLAALLITACLITPLPIGLVLGKRARDDGCDPWLVAFGMMPRGLPGLAFSTIAFTAGYISAGLFSALVLAVTVTNVIGPVVMTLRMNYLRQAGGFLEATLEAKLEPS